MVQKGGRGGRKPRPYSHILQSSPMASCQFTPTPGSPCWYVAPHASTFSRGLRVMEWLGTRSQVWPCTQGAPWTWFLWAVVGSDVQAEAAVRAAGSEWLPRLGVLGLLSVKFWSWRDRLGIPVMKSKGSRQTGHPALPLTTFSSTKGHCQAYQGAVCPKWVNACD